MDAVITAARSNKVAAALAIQDFSQLWKDNRKEAADSIVNITSNIIYGQILRDTAKP